MAGQSRTGRFVWLAAVCLALGAATSVGLAWGFAAWRPMAAMGGRVAIDGDHLQPWLIRLDDWSGVRLTWFEKGRIYSKQGVGPPGGSSAAVSCWSFATRTRSDAKFAKGEVALPREFDEVTKDRTRYWGLSREARGWPWPAMSFAVAGEMSPSAREVYRLIGGTALPEKDALTRGPSSIFAERALPLRPEWPGFALDTTALGAGWAVLLVGGGRVLGIGRGARRLARGRCPRCAYDLAGGVAGGCPECGWGRAA
jgi:hypothetical protein